MVRKRLGELLLERRVINNKQLEQALEHHRETGQRLGAALLALNFLTEAQLCDALAQGLGLTAVSMPPKEIDWTALRSLPPRFCEANDLFPLAITTSKGRKTIVVAMADPLNLPAIEEVEFRTGLNVSLRIAPLSGIRSAVRRHYYKQTYEEPAAFSVSDTSGSTSDEMVIIRPGGKEQVVSNRQAQADPVRGQTLSTQADPVKGQTLRTEEPDQPDRDRELLAEQIKSRAERRQQYRALPQPQGSEQGTAPASRSPGTSSKPKPTATLVGVKVPSQSEQLERLEHRFWALIKILGKKGLITREELLQGLTDVEE